MTFPENGECRAYTCAAENTILPRAAKLYARGGCFVLDEKPVQTALIEQRKKITLTAVISVDSFTDKQILLTLDGCRAQVSGDGLKIVNFSKTSGAFSAVGRVDGLRFLHGREKALRRLFK